MESTRSSISNSPEILRGFFPLPPLHASLPPQRQKRDKNSSYIDSFIFRDGKLKSGTHKIRGIERGICLDAYDGLDELYGQPSLGNGRGEVNRN